MVLSCIVFFLCTWKIYPYLFYFAINNQKDYCYIVSTTFSIEYDMAITLYTVPQLSNDYYLYAITKYSNVNVML